MYKRLPIHLRMRNYIASDINVVYKISAAYLSGARVRFFLEIRDLGSPTISKLIMCFTIKQLWVAPGGRDVLFITSNKMLHIRTKLEPLRKSMLSVC